MKRAAPHKQLVSGEEPWVRVDRERAAAADPTAALMLCKKASSLKRHYLHNLHGTIHARRDNKQWPEGEIETGKSDFKFNPSAKNNGNHET